MRRLLLVVCLLLTHIASAGDYVTVTGSGKTIELAKQQAFRKAIEIKVGALVLSDVETQNYTRVKDDIYIYSAGYVNDYRILKQAPSEFGVTVLVDVNVSESKLKNRILSDGTSVNTFEGEKHQAQLSTYIDERTKAYQLLQKLMDGYPNKFYSINQPTYSIKMDSQNNAVLTIPYKLSVNYEFIKSTKETLDTIKNCTPEFKKDCVSLVRIHAKDPKDWLIGERSDYHFNDIEVIDLIHNNFVENQPRIIVEFYDVYNRFMSGTCITPRFVYGDGSFFNDGSRNMIVLHGNKVEEGVISIPLNIAFIDKISKIQLAVKSKNICHN